MIAVLDTYLAWIDTKHYPTFNHFASEVDRLGLSVRIQSMGLALAMRGKTVFLAHDEGEFIGCPSCWSDDLKQGTGGWAVVDRKRITYRAFHGRRAGRGRITADTRVKKRPCRKCGGRGQFPHGRIFGFFVASAVEYVVGLKTFTVPSQLTMKRRGVVSVSYQHTRHEAMRGYGHRRPGSFYLVGGPDIDEDSRPVHRAAKRLGRRKSIDPKQIFIHGRLASFDLPIEIPKVMRFSGAQRWKLPKRGVVR
jgi:hypothetical protein